MESPMDRFLGNRLEAYDKWLKKGLISHSSRVIPVSESFAPEQWVLPTDQVLEIIETAGTVAVQDCECRRHYQRCDHPIEVCLVLNHTADKLVARGEARRLGPGEAEKILRQAHQSGLVHLSLYMPDHEIYALCSCCTCCCHDLQMVQQYGRKDLMVHSAYLAITSPAECILCGECIDCCPFGARRLDEDRLVCKQEDCLGCGLCVTVCPAAAVSMERRGSLTE